RTYLNLFLTMLLGGLWHGASWSFVIWGALHGGWLAIERFWARHRPAGLPRAPRWMGIVLTFHIVVLGWIFFRAQGEGEAFAYLGQLFAGDGRNTLVTPLSLALVALGLAIHVMPADILPGMAMRLRRQGAWVVGLTLGILILIVDAMRPEGVAPFIYYQF
ncbi:MBOAT family protein, partial [Nostoc sp. 3335mG]